MASSRRNFKKSFSAETQRRGRTTTIVKIRKEKRKQHLKKKRAVRTSPEKAMGFGQPPLPNPASRTGFGPANPDGIPAIIGMHPAGSAMSTDNSTLNLDDLKRGITSENPETRLAYTKKVRKLLSKEEDPPAREVIGAGIVPILINHLGPKSDAKLQFEAAWALTNIASTEFTHVVVEKGAVAPLARLMKSHSPDVREQSCWCLGNVAGDGPKLRDIVLKTESCLDNLLLNITHSSSQSMRRNATWALSNFCRGKPQPSIEAVRPALPILHWLIKLDDDEVLRDACWAFSYISDGDDDRIQAVIEYGPVPTLVSLLAHESTTVVTPALRTIGNVISGNDQQTQHAMSCKALHALVPLLDHEKKNVRKEACWTLSNIAAGTFKQAEELVYFVCPTDGEPVIKKVVKLACEGEWEVRKEAAWILANICTGGNVSNIQALVDNQALTAIVKLLPVEDVKIVMVALEALEAVLRKGLEAGHRWDLIIEEVGGQDNLEQLQEHDSDEVYQKSMGILKRYFDAEEEVDEGDVDGDQFGFNVDPSTMTDDFGLGGPSF